MSIRKPSIMLMHPPTILTFIEADTAEKVGPFLTPLPKLGSAEITPVTNLVEEARRKHEEAKKLEDKKIAYSNR